MSAIDEPAGKVIERAVSPLSPAEKKPLGIMGTSARESTNNPTAAPMVIQRWRMARSSTAM
ncbi:hypothetical protein D3C78_1834200 [compost metagenome]